MAETLVSNCQQMLDRCD
uniref:Uncharacterized protein n=1 Tax=Lepeophtheirus salmonis TaxID=72036 RepID=A0A0K2TCQ5_LEPSM